VAPLWLILLLFNSNFSVYAQELPPTENFTPVEYGAENQNWGISQSKQKHIYVANSGGLLEFNGASWKLYGSPNGSTIRSVNAVNDVIFTGCYMEFGFWKKNNLGDLIYESISSALQLPLLEDEDFWNILAFEKWVLFQSKERIYMYNTTDKTVRVIDSKSTKAQIFNFKNSIYYHSIGKGLFKIENGESQLVSDNVTIRNSVVAGIFELEKKPLIVTEKGEFYFLEANNLIRWKKSINDTIGSINVYSSRQLADGSIILGTISNGIYHIDKYGVVLQKMDQEKGLNNNTVLSIFEDVENNLWLALDNGLSVINMKSPFKEYIDKNGKLGVVYASTKYKGYLYLGTNQGLFYKQIGTDGNFELVSNTKGQVWFLRSINDTLFCGHNNGTYTINGTNASLISNFPGTWDVKPVPNRANLLLQGNFKGVSVLSKINNEWKLRNIIDGFDISSRFFEFIGPDRLVVNHEFKGIYELDLNNNLTEVVAVKNEPPKGIGASLAIFEDDVLYTCKNGIFRYHKIAGQFVVDTVLTPLFFGKEQDPIGIFISDIPNDRLWSFNETNLAYAIPGRFISSPEIKKIAIPSNVIKNLGVLGFESLTPIGDERYLIGISNGYLTIDLTKLSSKEYAIAINSIARKSYNSEFEKVAKDTETTFESSQNNLFISYNVPEFDKYTEVNYQYKLAGLHDNWSEWTSSSSASFDNLPFGDYTFDVRAKVGNNFSVNEASYSFRIERPWYLSNLAIILYIVALFLVAVLVHKLYKRYYRKQREQLLQDTKKELKRKKLKTQKKIVQINNEKLKEEVESKNRELAISTMSIIKKNEFLSAIKGQLMASADNPGVKSVIRTIDRNINNADDWKFFEDAFNNADKDFLKKIKGMHTELTANDLRLCAYLRLNLSSKEIAPLLNISVKSVEVKRYRLRKKMDLPHEEGLANYIMEI